MAPRNFRDTLALLAFLLVIPALWVAGGMGVVKLPGEVTGASISVWTLMAQFYFRKSMPQESK